MDPFNAFDLRSFKIIEILGTSSEVKKHCIGWLISAKKGYKIIKKLYNFYFKTIFKNKRVLFLKVLNGSKSTWIHLVMPNQPK